jgi:predicted kinase
MGLPASGKTTLARALAGRLGVVHISSDVVRKQLAGLRPSERRREGFGQGLYGPAASFRTYAVLRRRAARWLRLGRSVVLDATYGNPAERRVLPALARRLGAALVVVECCADEPELRRRLVTRERDATTASDARSEIWPELRAAYTEPCELPDVNRVDTSASLVQQVQMVLDRLQVPTP